MRMWRTVWEFPRYEISDDGLVRVKEDQSKLPGYVINQHWSKGSLCVELYKGDEHYERRLWKLMERYWPRVEYPQSWKAPKYDPGPDGDGRFKLTAKQRQEIIDSPLKASELEKIYPVGERWIHRLKKGK